MPPGLFPPPPRAGDLWLALSDANIAPRTPSPPHGAWASGSCYIGDILEQVETHRTLLRLPEYVVPAALLVFGYPTQQQQEREKPRRRALEHIVHENAYRRMEPAELEAMLADNAGARPLRYVAGRLLQAQVQLRFLPRDVPLHGRVPQALSAVKTPAPGFGWKPGAGLHFPACFGKMEPVPANREERCL